MITGEFIGLKEANRALKSLPPTAKALVQPVMNTTAFQIYNSAAAKVRRRTGNLALRFLQWQARPRSLSAVVGVTGEGYYWKFLEYGTVKMPASPFLRSSADALRADHDARMIRALEQAARQIEQGGASVSGQFSRFI